MLAVLSPAKNLNVAAVDLPLAPTQPALMKDAASLMRSARGLTQKNIRELMGLSKDLAKLNYDRYRGFELPFTAGNALPAAMMFNGDVYRGLSARTLSHDDLAWSQDRIAILSGMFGVLRPLDLIQEHRMEMGTRLKTRRGTNLYAFWGNTITKQIARMLADHSDPTLVNLASGEYFKAVRPRHIPARRVVQCVFHDWKDEQRTPNAISFMAKYARGLMARYIVEQRLERADDLKSFDLERYRFQPQDSNEHTWVFGRTFVPVGSAAT